MFDELAFAGNDNLEIRMMIQGENCDVGVFLLYIWSLNHFSCLNFMCFHCCILS